MIKHKGAANFWDILRDAAAIVKPPQKITVAEAAEKYVNITKSGGFRGKWNAKETPYMVEPMNLLTSRRHTSLIFIGPAQSGKTQALIDCFFAYNFICDPSDMIVIDSSMKKVNDYSRSRLSRLIRSSPALKERFSKYNSHNHRFVKTGMAGNMLFLGWPSINNLTGKSVKFCAATDSDRMPLDIDGEGNIYDLLCVRNRTFKSGGMTLIDTSPGFEQLDLKWRPKTPHEAPPTHGGLALYNAGDRRQYYWKCLECGEWYIPGPGLNAVFIPDHGSDEYRAKNAKILCPHCNFAFNSKKIKIEVNKNGKWLKDGQKITKDDEIYGEFIENKRSSFWLHGTQARYLDLDEMIHKYLIANDIYAKTGTTDSLKVTENADQAIPFIPRHMKESRDSKMFENRVEYWEKERIPQGVRFLTASIDVQQNSFFYLVLGWGINNEQWIIDYKELRFSKRGNGVIIDPAVYLEDWNVLFKYVIKRVYKCNSENNLYMPILQIFCDSAGQPGVTQKAYNFFLNVKRHGYDNKFRLIKGTGNQRVSRIRETYPDTQKTINKSNKSKELPIIIINVNSFKDTLDADFNRDIFGSGYIHFPDWLPESFYHGLTRETRDPLKGWVDTHRKGGNEPIDLLVYARAAGVYRGVEAIDWEDERGQPVWALPWGKNIFLNKDVEKEEEALIIEPTQGKPVNKSRQFFRNKMNTDWI